NFNCLFCQNASHKLIGEGNIVGLDFLASKVSANSRYSCICYFGGSPEPQLPFAVKASKKIVEENPNRMIRICFEWNGCGNRELVKQAAELSLATGGNIKIDLKAFTPNLSLALSGVPNARAYENFEMIAREFYIKRADVPVLTATTLLVPGYVDSVEVESIAKFIGELNSEIPYSLLVFHPDFLMQDLPITPVGQVKACYESAKKHLKNVNIGNAHLLRETI
ncbi:MAG: radical SAM protein, partial [Candidatus Bathyarchaeia archaeon]